MQMRACLDVCRLATPMNTLFKEHYNRNLFLKAVLYTVQNCVGRGVVVKSVEQQQNSFQSAPVAKCQLDDDSPMSNGLSIRSSAKFS